MNQKTFQYLSSLKGRQYYFITSVISNISLSVSQINLSLTLSLSARAFKAILYLTFNSEMGRQFLINFLSLHSF